MCASSKEKECGNTSTLEGFEHKDVERVVNAVFGSSALQQLPRRFAMEDMVRVDGRSMGLLQASSLWKDSLPHVERIVEKERLSSTDQSDFVARIFRQQPGVVYAVRYWGGLVNMSSLTSALKNIRQAWIMCNPRNSQISPNRGTARDIHPSDGHNGGSAVGAKEANQKSFWPLEGQTSVSTDRGKHSTISAESIPATGGPGRGVQEEGCSSRQKAATEGSDHDTTRHARLEGLEAGNVAPGDINSQILSSPPEETPVPGRVPSKRSSPVRVHGFAVELDSTLRKARAALIAEWPGVGSLHDLLSGNIQDMGDASQEDLLRWTRQIAEGFTQASWGGSEIAGEDTTPRVSTRTAYLFRRPMDELQQGGGMLDVRLATFLGGCSIPGTGESPDTARVCRSLLPPEVLWSKPSAAVRSSPIKSEVGPGQHRTGREAADVWGLGTLVFELGTGRSAGPAPLAFRQLRDLIREVPIDPGFIYGDVARGVMRLALQRQPGDRARATEIAAAVEQITARTLRRAHTASDRQSRGRRDQRREATGEKGTSEDEGNTNDGYGKALAKWRIDEAVDRAEGRARVFLRRLWFNSLTEEDKRRIRHRRRHRKANQEAREWRARRVRAAKMHHWTPVQVASWISHLLWKAEASRKLPLLFSGDAKGGIGSMLEDDTEVNTMKDCVIAPGGKTKEQEEPGANSSKREEEHFRHNAIDTSSEEKESASSASAAAAAAAAAVAAAALPGVDPSNRGNGEIFSASEATIANNVTAVNLGMSRGSGDSDIDDDPDGRNQEKEYEYHDAYDDQSSSVEDGNANGDNATGWADVEAGERTGYAGASVEPFAVKEGIDGSCVIEAMDDASGHAEDALTRFVKSSTRLARPAEVEKKRVELMVRELLTVRPYSAPSQLKIRAFCVAIVRSAEAPRDLTENQVDAQLPSLARVLTAGYRRQVEMVEQGLEFAAARIQGLVRGKHIRRIFASIWQEAEEYARNIVRGERDARLKKEKEQRAREKEEALKREREEAERYRLRLVPRVSSVTCSGMTVSLPPFLVAAARGARRFLVVETTVVPPRHHPVAAPPQQRLSPPSDQTVESPTRRVGTNADAIANTNSPEETNNILDDNDRNWTKGRSGEANYAAGGGQIHVLLRQGAATELKGHLDSGRTTPSTSPTTRANSQAGWSGTARTKGGESGENPVQGRRRFLRAVGNGLSLSSLRPCTTYRLTLEVPPVIRNELLESARSLGLMEAIRSLETPTESDTHVANGGERVGGDRNASSAGHLNVETLPDVPSEVSFLTCKVLTSASAVDPRDPSGVLSLRQWQSPYPGVAGMDSPSSEDYVVVAPGRPEPLIALQWNEPRSNGLDVHSYVVERRVGRTGAWKKIRARDVGGDDGATVGGSTSERRDGGIRGAIRQRRSTDAVDAPLRTVSMDALRKVAVQGLSVAYRVYAENVLGAGAPSKPTEVNLGVFLGHLRAQQGGRREPASPRGQQQPSLLEMVPSARVADTLTPAVASKDNSLLSEPRINLTPDLEAQQAAEGGEPSDGGTPHNGTGADGAKTPHPQESSNGKHTPLAPEVPSACQTATHFGDDFMGLRSFGEPKVHDLFSPPSSPRRHDRPAHLCAPATEGAPRGAHQPICGVGGHGSGSSRRVNLPHPLPPIVLASRISGESRGRIPTTDLPGSHGRGQPWDGGGLGDDVHRGGMLVARMTEDPGDLDGRIRHIGDSANTNNVFHAFINLGRRLPGRLPRDREKRGRAPK